MQVSNDIQEETLSKVDRVKAAKKESSSTRKYEGFKG
jgi:hypothetical protein